MDLTEPQGAATEHLCFSVFVEEPSASSTGKAQVWEKASFSTAEFLTRTVKNTHEKTCNDTCCVSEAGAVGACIQNVTGFFFLTWLKFLMF